MVTLAEMTGLDTLHARPRAAFEGTKTYGTFWLSGSTTSRQEINEEGYLFLTKKGEMEQDFERLSISSQDDELCDTTVKSFGSCTPKG